MRKSLIGLPVLALTYFEQRRFIELDHREVFEERNVVGLAFLALKLLAGQRGSMLARELIDRVTDNYAEMLHSHLVNTAVNWRY